MPPQHAAASATARSRARGRQGSAASSDTSGWPQAAATRPAAIAATSRVGGSQRHMAVQRGHPRRAEPAHVVELLQRVEPAVHGAVIDDPLCQRRVDPHTARF